MFSDNVRSSLPAALTLSGLLALGGALCFGPGGCALSETPAPVVAAAPAPTPTPAPTPAPIVYVSPDDFSNGGYAAEAIPPALKSATEELRLAAISDLLKDPWSRKDFEKAGAFYVAVGTKTTELRDPGATVLNGLTGTTIPIKKYSECIADDQSVRDRASGARGVLFKVCRIAWTGPSSAMLEYGYTTGGIHGRMITAEAERNGTAWTFTPRKVAIY